MRLIPLAVSVLALTATAAAPSPFDRPVKVVRTALPKDPELPKNRARATCAYFRDFMVKEVDLGEVGAEQLSILQTPGGARGPACRRANAPGERVVPPDQWSGYFEGVKGPYVVFTAGDGWNGGMGFAVIDAKTGEKLFDDARLGAFRTLSAGPNGLVLQYRRVYAAKCSLNADAAGCWREIVRDTGLGGAAPDCAAAYAREARRTPKLASEVRSDPTVIVYDVEARVGAGVKSIAPVRGRAPSCAPAE